MIRNKLSTLLTGVLCAGLAAAPFPAGADDIDIFTGASAGTSVNPRILIVLDNTANWSRENQKWPGGLAQGQSEANAIKTVIGDLDGTISLGLMEFVTGGSSTDDGGFIRSAIVPMNADNKASFASQLTAIYGNINGPDEKHSSGTPYGNLMYDVYNYLAGANSYSPSAVLATKADKRGYVTPYTKFASPLTADNTCGKTFVIFIGNPSASGPTSDSAANTALLNTLNNNTDASGKLIPVTQLGLPNFSSKSVSTSTTVGATSACYASATAAAAELPKFDTVCADYTDKCQIGAVVASDAGTCTTAGTSRYSVVGTDTIITNVPTDTTSTDTHPYNADEWARLLHDRGIPVGGSTIRPSVTTYTIDVYNAQQNGAHTSLMLGMAKAGGGKYFAAHNEQAIVDALKEIMIEIQAVNTAFASTALPVNATNRSQNQNEVFIGMFRPDADAKPRWFGNLKKYQLIAKGADVELGDVNGKSAVNSVTGFLTPCATSAWTSDSGSYWSDKGVTPDPASPCTIGGFNKYSDAPDGPFVEKGGAAQILRQGNVAAGTGTGFAVNRTVLTLAGTALAPLSAANSGMDAKLVKFMTGEDVNNEKGSNQLTTTRQSIHGDVIHSRPLPINYGDAGVTVYYGANDGTLRALAAKTGVEKWAFVAPEFFPRLSRLMDNTPLVSYPNLPDDVLPTPKPKDYFFDGSIGVYQDANNTKVWIYPSMRRGGRMVYALDVTSPGANPTFKWRAGCPNLTNDTGCTDQMSAIGQTWSTPSVAFIKGYSETNPVVVMGGGYDSCEDADTSAPACSGKKGGAIFILDAFTGAVVRSFETERAVAADIAMVDIDNDGMPDYAYAADTGGNLYRVDFVSGATSPVKRLPVDWTKRTVARTAGGGRKFLFAPALLATKGYVYLAIGSGDREHPLYEQYPYAGVTNRFYVYKDDLALALASPVQDLDALEDYSAKDDCGTPPVLPSNGLKGWFMNLTANGKGEQTVTSALIAGGMVTFSTNRPIPPAAGTCSTTLGEARGYWVNLLNASGAIGVQGACGGQRSSPFVGGGLPPSPVLANLVPVGSDVVTVVIGAVQKGSNGAGGASVAISPQRIRPAINSKRKRAYSYTSAD
ncbi:MAG: pilus assembly protein [Massilia sp.]